MTARLIRLTRLWPYALIAAAALLSHGLLLFNDGIYWDDWPLQRNMVWEDYREQSLEMGLPLMAYFSYGLRWSGLLGFYKPLAFLSLIFSAILVFRLVVRFNYLNRHEALGVALLSLAYPAYQTTVVVTTFQYEFFYCLFLLAALLMMLSEQAGISDRRRLLLRVLSPALFFLSFSVNSLLVFYFPFLALVFFHIKQTRQLSWANLTRTVLPYRIDFLVLPFVYWGIKKIFYPVHGEYGNYNTLNLGLDSLAAHLGNFIKTAVYAQVEGSVTRLLEHPWAWILAMGGIYWGVSKFGKTSARADWLPLRIEQESRKTKWILVFGVLLLIGGIFPYAAVGLSPLPGGWNTRHALLVGLPVALLLVSSLRYIWMGHFDTEQQALNRRIVSLMAGCSLLAAFGLSTVAYYVGWQARAVKDRAIMADLADVAVLKPFSVFWIDDQYPLGGERIYRFYEWSSMFKQIWGGERRIGLQLQGYGQNALPGLKPYYNKRNNLSEFDPGGCRVVLTLTRGTLQYSEGELVWQYYIHRFFKQAQLQDFLHGVLRIDVHFPEVEDKRCPVSSVIKKN